MKSLPDSITAYIIDRSLNFSNPAYLQFDKSMKIVDSGGELERYGLENRIGEKIENINHVFEGYLPCVEEEIELPAMKLSDDIYADVYIFKSGGGCIALFIDASETSKHLRDFIQKRNDEKLMLDNLLSFEENPVVFDIVRVLDVLILEKIDSARFKAYGKAPKWADFLAEKSDGVIDKEKLVEIYPFIEYFINTAEIFWKNNNKGMIRSDLWTEIGERGEEVYMETIAVSIMTRKFLLFQHSTGSAEEKFNLIQRARELSLEHELRIKAEKKLKEQNEQLNRLNVTKDKFFSIIAHDLRNPLGAFRNIIELFSNYYDKMDEDFAKDTISLLDKQSLSLIRLLENLLQWSRAQMGAIRFEKEMNNFKSLVDIVVNLVDSMAKEKGVYLINSVKPGTIISYDQDIMGVILRNLITNAIKFTESGGRVEISCEENDKEFVVCVADTGIGISEKDAEKLFRIDVNTNEIGASKEKGAGLGLILCKEFVNMHGGEIRVESEFGKGSKFFFNIPK